MNDISILLVEGSAEERTLIHKYLSSAPPFHYSLSEAETLEAALSLLADNDFDVVLLNLDLPDSSGLDTARRIITELHETAVIVLANPQDEELAEQSLRYGTEDFIQKRFLSSPMLIKSIRYAIERKIIVQEKYDVLSDLMLALEKIDYLESFLPICIGCKKIFHEEHGWLDLEEFSRQASSPDADCLICPNCREELTKN